MVFELYSAFKTTLNPKTEESTLWNSTQTHGQYLQNNLLVNGKLGNDVCQEQVATVLAGWVHTGLGQEARPGKGHQAPQFAVPVLVVVVDVMGGVLHQQRGKLQQIDPQRIQHISLFFWIKYLVPGMIKEDRMKWRKKTTSIIIINFIIIKAKSLFFNFLVVFKTTKNL